MKKLLIIISIVLLHSSCLRVTFSGASIHPEAKTFSVQYFENNASLVQPILSQILTEQLRDKIMGQTQLSMVSSGGDMAFEGEITGYTLSPVAIQSGEAAQLTQLTITINVRFFNALDDNKNFESRFSRYQQFSTSSNFSSIEEGLVEDIVTELVEDIFNKAFVNW